MAVVVNAREEMRKALTMDLGCRIADAKSRIVASSPGVSRKIAAKLGMGQAVRRSAPNLGIDVTAAAKRRTIRVGGSLRKARFGKCAKRGKKLSKIARALGPRAVKVFTAGIAPEANYGAEVWGGGGGGSSMRKQ